MSFSTYSIYRLFDGLFVSSVSLQDISRLADCVSEGHGCVQGDYDLLSQRVDVESGLVVDYQPPSPSENHAWDSGTKRWIYVPTLADHKARCLAAINATCTESLAHVTDGYPLDEIQSWAKQELEARAYVASTLAPIPLLTALSAARGVAIPDLVERIISKSNAFAVISGQYIGNRQRCEDQINAAKTIAEVQVIRWAE
jgi:hypothetical protein